MTILQECEVLPQEKRRHFVKLIDRGRTENFKFIVMQMVGTSIDKLQKQQLDRQFSFTTTIKLGIETLEGISNLHDLGYLHRDIKPQNFTIGLKEKSSTIYILDFGIARRYTERTSKAIRLPRKKVRFLGTVRFASRTCHRSQEQGRRDDLESWVYMLLEFTEYACLPWSRIIDREEHIGSLPEEFHVILNYINGLNYENTPDYEYITKMLQLAAERKKVKITDKFDWEEMEEEVVFFFFLNN
ncbi:unnamed protein product [Gongylonema pulchrum]|uniref:non-specific serine/threonine protein kinase n=1 Tax=Gongylonema pulchrum TaxID=637853 RepID=A0A183EFU0_9BILA|nr:unnamed protein product [Gongylonema pulchrum]